MQIKRGRVIVVAMVGLSAFGLSTIAPARDNQPKAATAKSRERVVHFPKDHSMGKLLIQDESVVRKIQSFFYWTEDGTKWENLGQAMGDVNIPAGKQLALVISSRTGGGDLSALSDLRPDDLYRLSIYSGPPNAPKFDDRIMPYIAHLTGLKILGIGAAAVSIKGLRLLHSLKSLEQLSPPKELTDEGLAEVVQLKSLKGLYLGESRLTDAGLAHLADLTSLEELELGQGQMTNAGLAHLAKLSSLWYLLLSGKNFTDASMAHLKNIPSLRVAHLGSMSHLTDAALMHLAQVKTLESLSLHWADAITDDGVGHLTKLPSLKKLDIRRAKVTDKCLAQLSRVKTLEYLVLPDQGITDVGLSQLGQLQNLKHLWLSRAHYVDPNMNKDYFTDRGVAELAKCKQLEELIIGGIGITDTGLDHIVKLTNLKQLNLFGCIYVTDAGLEKLTALKSLQDLSVGESSITVGGLSCLNKLPNLVRLDFHGVRQDDSGLDLSRLSKLEEISLYLKTRRVGKELVNDQLHDRDLACLTGLKRLEWLQVSHGDVSDDGLKYLSGLINIERLSVGGKKVTDKGLLHLMNMSKLDTLTLSGSFTDEALIYLERQPSLSYLTIMEGANFSAAAVQRFQRNMPELVVFRQNVRKSMQLQSNQPKPIAPPGK